jgi:hypothetical protein
MTRGERRIEGEGKEDEAADNGSGRGTVGEGTARQVPRSTPARQDAVSRRPAVIIEKEQEESSGDRSRDIINLIRK